MEYREGVPWMDIKKSKRLIAIAAGVFWLLVAVIFLVAQEQFRFTAVQSNTLTASAVVGEITDGITVRQLLTAPADQITGVDILFDTYGRSNTGTLQIRLEDLEGNLLAEEELDVSQLKNVQYAPVVFDEAVQTTPEARLMLSLSSNGCSAGNAVTVYYGNSLNVGRANLSQEIPTEERYEIAGDRGIGKLCVRLSGIDQHPEYVMYFWAVVGGVFLAAALFCRRWWKEGLEGKNNPLVMICTLYSRYTFLLKQLVSRDFKNKYKRSVLGVAWSFLNPLMTMSVQYLVFSTLFKSDTPNYPVYLLTGILFFNYLNEAVSQGMISITGNAALIKKVYIPKYMFPMSKVMSSMINFLVSFIPLLLVMIITGTKFRFSLLLLTYDVLCLLAFVTGMVLLLSTAMTFFQDTQFLWGVISMVWMYLTPVFYPETIIPQSYLTVYRMNPMYQFITFARTCIIDGIAPRPDAFVKCGLWAAVMLVFGLLTFRKHQDKFVLYM